MRPPDFWSSKRLVSTLLVPAGLIYAAATARRLKRAGWAAPVPVICAGNIGIGGAGKTPTAIALARLLAEAGRAPHFLSRGYRGREAGPVRVDPARHDHKAVGDEPLLLARAAPAWVARDRAAGARAAAAAGAGCIVMDDGHQNPDPVRNLSLVVVDGGYGFGNGRVIPAGPLREPVPAGLARADAIVLIGEDETDALDAAGGKPVWRARIEPDEIAAGRLAGKRVVAFAGIGRPDKFFATLKALGAELIDALPFPDHHAFSENDVMLACEVAAKHKAVPVTTEKDFVRLPPDARPMVEVLPIRLVFADRAAVARRLAALWS